MWGSLIRAFELETSLLAISTPFTHTITSPVFIILLYALIDVFSTTASVSSIVHDLIVVVVLVFVRYSVISFVEFVYWLVPE